MVLMFIWINVKQQPELPAYNKTEVHRTTSMYKLKYTQIFLSKVKSAHDGASDDLQLCLWTMVFH